MKVLIEKEMGDVADLHGKGGVYVEDGMLKAKVEIVYPIVKAIEPLMAPIDTAFQSVEDAIPGDWDKAILEPIKEGLKAELMKLVAEQTA